MTGSWRFLVGAALPVLVGNLWLANDAAMAACTGGVDTGTGTTCSGGSTTGDVRYVDSNGVYVSGDFTLTLENHEVISGAVILVNTVGGDGEIILDNSHIRGGGGLIGDGIIAIADAADAAVEDITVTLRNGSSITAEAFGIDAESTFGSVTITTTSDTEITTTGDDILSSGIRAEAAGAVSVTANGKITAGHQGIAAGSTGGGAVKVFAGSQVTAADDGIRAGSLGTVEVMTGDNAQISGARAGIAALSATSITITTGANSQTTGDLRGIEALASGAGTIAITNNGTVAGATAGIEVLSETGGIQITNNLIIGNASERATDLAIRTLGGPADISNAGIITGRIETGGIADRLDNAGIWITGGISNFGAGADTVNNNGTLAAALNDAAAETANLVGLETLTNAGRIVLADQFGVGGANVSDRLTTSGNYIGQGAAELFVDASLGGSDSLSDVLAVGGDTSGVTRVQVNDINQGAGVFNPVGILVVDVTGTGHEGDFVLAGGPIDKGLFVYDLVFRDDPSGDQFLLVSFADDESFETLATVASAQEIARETENAWEGRLQTVRDRLAHGVQVTAVADPPIAGRSEAESSLWFQALGSWAERNSRGSGFDLDYDQSISGFVAGADVGVSLGTETTVLFGLLAGYVDSSLDFNESSTSIRTDGATFGIYASYLEGGFFANVLVKAERLGLDYSAPSLAPLEAQDDTDVTSVGGRADIGFRFAGDGLFIEPMLSLDAISTTIDEFSVGGADIDPGTNDSIRGGAGLRLGVDSDSATASATARVWNVFDNDNEVDIASGGVLAISDDTLEGVYGEVSGQVDLDLSTSTALFVRGSYLFSDDFSKPSVSGGLNIFW